MLRLLAFFVVRSSGLLRLQFQSVFIYIFDWQWKSTLLAKETLHIMWEKCQEECQFNFILRGRKRLRLEVSLPTEIFSLRLWEAS